MEECAVESIEANCTHLHSPPFMLYYALSSLYSTTHLLLHAQLCTLFIELNYIPSLSHSSMHFLFHAWLYLLLHSKCTLLYLQSTVYPLIHARLQISCCALNCAPLFPLCAQLCTISFALNCMLPFLVLKHMPPHNCVPLPLINIPNIYLAFHILEISTLFLKIPTKVYFNIESQFQAWPNSPT